MKRRLCPLFGHSLSRHSEKDRRLLLFGEAYNWPETGECWTNRWCWCGARGGNIALKMRKPIWNYEQKRKRVLGEFKRQIVEANAIQRP